MCFSADLRFIPFGEQSVTALTSRMCLKLAACCQVFLRSIGVMRVLARELCREELCRGIKPRNHVEAIMRVIFRSSCSNCTKIGPSALSDASARLFVVRMFVDRLNTKSTPCVPICMSECMSRCISPCYHPQSDSKITICNL